jgi:uncharacterized protein
MAIEQLSLSTLNFYAPRFDVEIGNQRLSANMSKAIIDLTVEERLDEGASFRMTIHDDFDMKTQKFKWLDHELFNVGNKITIRMGYGNSLSPMIIGSITSLEPSFFSGELPTLTIGGQDLSYDYMKRTSPERTFANMKHSDIAVSIASEAGLMPVADSTSLLSEFIRKGSDETYYAFLERLAREAGYQFGVEGQTMYFIQPQDDRKEILTLQLGKDIVRFRPAMRTSGLVSEVEVRGHNPQDPSQPFIGRASAGSERSQESGRRTGSRIAADRCGTVRRVITDRVVHSTEHATSIARAELNSASDGLVEGDGECIGIPQIRTGVSIKLEKMGDRFSGKYYVKGTTHRINGSGYRTSFTVKRNAV